MGTIIFLLGLAIAVGLIVVNRKNIYKDSKFNFIPLIIPVVILIGTIIAVSFNPFRLEKINAGTVGVQVKLMGSQRGVTDYKYKSGRVLYNTWFTEVVEIPITIQHVDYKDQSLVTKGGFILTCNPSFNYRVKAETAGDMYVNLRKTLTELQEGWIKTAIIGSANDIANKWTIDSVFNNLALFETSIRTECNRRMERWFEVDKEQFRINVIPPPALVQSINDKTKAIQDVQVAENRKRVAIAQGEERIAKERADSTVETIKVTTLAANINRVQQEITPMYLELKRIEAWEKGGSQVPTTILGDGGGVLFNMINK